MSIHSSSLIVSSIVTGIIISITIPATAQIQLVPNPNRDRIPQPQPIPSPLPTTPPVLTPTTPAPSPSEGSGITIDVKKIEITGSTVFKSEDFTKLVQGIEGKSVKLQDLQTLTNAITALYLDRGYITSRAVLGEQAITNGVVKIQIIEGAIDRIDIEGLKRLNKNYIQSRIQLGTKTPLNKNQLDRKSTRLNSSHVD